MWCHIYRYVKIITVNKIFFFRKENFKLQWKMRMFWSFLQATQPTKRRSESVPGEDLRVRINAYFCFIFVWLIGRKSEIAHILFYSVPENSKWNWITASYDWTIYSLISNLFSVFVNFLVFIYMLYCCVKLTTNRFQNKNIWISFQWYTTTFKGHSSACRGRRKKPRVAMWISSASKASPYPTCPLLMTRPLQTKELSNSSRTAASTWFPLSPPPPNHFPRSKSLRRETLISKPEG